MAKKKTPKPVVLKPKAPKREKKEEEIPRTKRSVIVYKTEKPFHRTYPNIPLEYLVSVSCFSDT